MMLEVVYHSLPLGNRLKYKLSLIVACISVTLFGHLNGYQVNTWRPVHGMLGHSVHVRD